MRGNAGKSVHFELTNEKWLVINSYFPTSFNFVLQVLLVGGFEPVIATLKLPPEFPQIILHNLKNLVIPGYSDASSSFS